MFFFFSHNLFMDSPFHRLLHVCYMGLSQFQFQSSSSLARGHDYRVVSCRVVWYPAKSRAEQDGN